MCDVSVVIPVYNGSASIAAVVSRVMRSLSDRAYEIILVDDGSADQSVEVCRQLCKHHSQVTLVELSRNFGEHNAVLAGLAHTSGATVAVLDDDAQNPPEELPRMLAMLESQQLDVVYGRYMQRKHSLWRRLGSWFNDRMANLMLGKPPGLYLSSFKVMSRFIVDQVLEYQGPYPYIDGLICRSTRRLGEIDVQHAMRAAGASNYTLVRLLRLWMNMFMGFSILPLRITSLLGLAISALSAVWLLLIIVDKLWISPHVTAGIPTVLACLVLFSGVQLMVLGMVGEYVGRMFLTTNGQPQYIVRHVRPGARSTRQSSNGNSAASCGASQQPAVIDDGSFSPGAMGVGHEP